MIDKNIKQIAKRARANLVNLFKQYPNTKTYLDTLCCMCNVASQYLFYALKKHNIHSNFVLGYYDGHSHCWIELENYIIDLTVKQFPKAPKRNVYITKVSNKHYIKIIQNKSALNETKHWPSEQRYSTYKKELKKML